LLRLDNTDRGIIDPYLPIGEFGPYPARLRQQVKGVELPGAVVEQAQGKGGHRGGQERDPAHDVAGAHP
jgi:hypothetical protein